MTNKYRIVNHNYVCRKFQRMFNLDQTGELDEETKRMMSQPRCGVKDSPKSIRSRSNYIY